MAFGTTGAGTLTKEQTLISIRRFPVAANGNITKGNVVVFAEGTGDVDVATAVGEGAHFVALESVDNTGGSSGDLYVPCAIPGHYVTVVVAAAQTLVPGQKVIPAAAGAVAQYVNATHVPGDEIGIYLGKEGGSISKAAGTPFDESFTDGADFEPVNAGAADVVEILLVDN
jgi:hypothetical protein